MRRWHIETHRTDRVGWLRAAVLGANDGIISIAGLVVGVAASGADARVVLGSGIAGIVAGAMSMAAGEYVSVQSQADTEHADIAKETRELAEDPDAELQELTHIYVQRGLSPELAKQVAQQLTAHDALGAHARDELGITESLRARPLQAALSSAAAFAAGAVLPILAVLLAPVGRIEPAKHSRVTFHGSSPSSTSSGKIHRLPASAQASAVARPTARWSAWLNIPATNRSP